MLVAYCVKGNKKAKVKMRYNKSMKKGRARKGFTIIEVAIFLAISGMLFVMVLANTAIRVTSRRYSDAVYDLAEELKNAYSATVNVENYRNKTEDSGFFCSITSAFRGASLIKNSSDTDNYPGRSRCAVYGQVITFGEDGKSDVHRYDIIGLAKDDNIEPSELGDDDDEHLDALFSDAVSSSNEPLSVRANIVTIRNTGNNTANCSVNTAGNFYAYTPQWQATIENKKNHNIYHGAVMIARSPITGTIHTYLYSNVGDPKKDNSALDSDAFYVQKFIRDNTSGGCAGFANKANSFVKYAYDKKRWYRAEPNGSETWMDICVGGEDSEDLNGVRRAIRIHGDGSTEAAIEVLTEIDSNNICKI